MLQSKWILLFCFQAGVLFVDIYNMAAARVCPFDPASLSKLIASSDVSSIYDAATVFCHACFLHAGAKATSPADVRLHSSNLLLSNSNMILLGNASFVEIRWAILSRIRASKRKGRDVLPVTVGHLANRLSVA